MDGVKHLLTLRICSEGAERHKHNTNVVATHGKTINENDFRTSLGFVNVYNSLVF